MSPRFTDAQYQYARYQCSALEVAQKRGFPLVKEGRNYRAKGHSSMVFTADGKFFWNAKKCRGRAIEFLMAVEGMTLKDAVLYLASDMPPQQEPSKAAPARKPPAEKKPAVFKLPTKYEGRMHRLYAYLLRTRGLDHAIVEECVKRGILYECVQPYHASDGKDRETHNAVFLALDENGTPRSGFIRGMSSLGPAMKFKRDIAGNDYDYPFTFHGREGTTTVIVFEGAIDALSHATILKRAGLDYQASDRIALGGSCKDRCLFAYLKRHKEINRVVLALDEDEAGRKSAKHIAELLRAETQCEVLEIHQSLGKDWNDAAKLSADIAKAYFQKESPLSSEFGRILHLNENNEVAYVTEYQDAGEYRRAAVSCLNSAARVVLDCQKKDKRS